jgi:release factor glutamine methyltransferase
MQIAEALLAARSAFEQAGLETGSELLDAQLLLAHTLGRSREYLLAHSDDQLSPVQQLSYEGMVDRRAAGEPLAYLTGRRAFWTFELEVSPAVLIPRPETECLVEAALDIVSSELNNDAETAEVSVPLTIADLGTGSGAIALALAQELPKAKVIGVDLSREALMIATANAARLGLPVSFVQSNWADALDSSSLDILLANPPYVAAEDPHLRQTSLPFEPRQALVAAQGGMADLRQIAEQARDKLRAGGWLLMEHGFDQQAEILSVLRGLGYQCVRGRQDLAGIDRLVMARWAAR